MNETAINQQISDLNKKVDLLLEYINQQRLQNQAIQDLISDATIIGKDVYNSTVDELDKRQLELNPQELTNLGVSLLRNINNFNVIMNTFESAIDLGKDLSPIITESIIDFTKMMADMEAKGYFDFIKKMAEIGDEIISQVSIEDLDKIKKNIPDMIEIMKKITDGKTLQLTNRALESVDKTDIENPPEMGIWSLMKAMNDPGMKKSLGLIVSITKKMY